MLCERCNKNKSALVCPICKKEVCHFCVVRGSDYRMYCKECKIKGEKR